MGTKSTHLSSSESYLRTWEHHANAAEKTDDPIMKAREQKAASKFFNLAMQAEAAEDMARTRARAAVR